MQMVNEFKLLRGYTDPLVNLQISMELLCKTMERYNESLIKMNEGLSRINDSLSKFN